VRREELMGTGRNDDDDTSNTEPELASGSEASARRRPTGGDTIPDLRVETHALLDRLLPSDGRALPPRPLATQGASSSGGSFVAYSGEGRPAEASRTEEPVDTVVVMREPEEATREPEAPRRARRDLDKTLVIARRRRRRWPLVVAGVVAGMAGLVVLFLVLRG
jgi:hypothetical protein